jgi:para-aminobenzoate synthetase
VRTLLIDNYDSYTYNLFQLIAGVNGSEPTVLTNDAALPSDLSTAFDNVVISPGPGRPDEPRDFGISADIIESAEIPVLGVCLGHQGIAASAGAQICPAPRARHGHLTRVRHNNSALFRGIPQEFTAVRYHSLCVLSPLPAPIEAIAWAEDDIVMALRHQIKPLWGVQFHPESVATGFGAELMGNFWRLTADYLANRERRQAPGREPVRIAVPGRAWEPPGSARPVQRASVTQDATELAPPAPPTPPAHLGYRLHVRTVRRAVDTEAAFTRLFARSDNAFWLDSARAEAGLARFSMLGEAAGELAEVAVYRVGDSAVQVHRAGGVAVSVPGTIFDYLERELTRRSVDAPDLPFDFSGGYVGYFGYELKADCGSPNAHRASTPDAVWVFPDRMVTVDHEEGVTYLLALSDGAPEADAAAADWLLQTQTALRQLPNGMGGQNGAGGQNGGHGKNGGHGQNGQNGIAPDEVERRLVRDRRQYLDDIAVCKHKLRQGESYEICLTNALRVPAAEDGYAFYRRLRRVNPAPYAAFLKVAGVTVASSSPERFLRVDRTGTAESKPIKGTAPRGRTPAEDDQLKAELTASDKTRAENLMIVDLVRNDLGRVCEVGSVHVPRLMATETYETVHQLVSTIRGQLRADVSVIDAVRACFPGGSMTGAPKLRTMEIIDSLETEARGVYSGAIGFVGCNRTADLNIVIRTAVLADGQWQVGAGGAIVLDSDPALEYEEMLLKAMASMRAYRPADADARRDADIDRAVDTDIERAVERDRPATDGDLITTMRAGELWLIGNASLASRARAPFFPCCPSRCLLRPSMAGRPCSVRSWRRQSGPGRRPGSLIISRLRSRWPGTARSASAMSPRPRAVLRPSCTGRASSPATAARSGLISRLTSWWRWPPSPA